MKNLVFVLFFMFSGVCLAEHDLDSCIAIEGNTKIECEHKLTKAEIIVEKDYCEAQKEALEVKISAIEAKISKLESRKDALEIEKDDWDSKKDAWNDLKNKAIELEITKSIVIRETMLALAGVGNAT